MADISKCSGENCLKKLQCYRYIAPDGYYQSYFKTSPKKQFPKKECQHFWDIKTR